MTFETHIDEMHKKVMSTLIFLNRMKNNIPVCTRVLLVQALALSIINYCSKIWGMAGKTQIQRVQKLQNFASKIVTANARKYDHATPYINSLKWLKIEAKCIFDICVYIFKVIRKQVPTWLLPLTTVGEVNFVTTRQHNRLYVPQTRTVMGDRQMLVRGPSLWNKIPSSIRDVNSTNVFKTKLKEHLLKKQT